MFVDRYRFPNGQKHQRQSLPCLRDWREIIAAHNTFEDGESRALFRALIVYRYGSPKWSSVTCNREMAEALDAFMGSDRPSEPIPCAPSVLNEPIARWCTSYNGRPVEIDTIKYGLYWTEISNQYFLRRGDVFIGPEPGDTVLDCGACLGDTAVKFAAHAGPPGHVYSFDPLPLHVAIARDVARRNNLPIETFCCGISASTRPSLTAALTTPIEVVKHDIAPGRPLAITDATIAIDAFAARLPRVDLIKMDIEGSEIDALTGADATISRFKPKLQICVYHKPSDLWIIPLMIKRRYPFYRLFLGHHSLHLEETVLYAISAPAAPQDGHMPSLGRLAKM